jgi:hypothetical protein
MTVDAFNSVVCELIVVLAGISCSVAFAIASLKEEEHLALFDAFQQVLAKHPQARPHLALWQSLCEYYDENLPYKDILKLILQQKNMY